MNMLKNAWNCLTNKVTLSLGLGTLLTASAHAEGGSTVADQVTALSNAGTAVGALAGTMAAIGGGVAIYRVMRKYLNKAS